MELNDAIQMMSALAQPTRLNAFVAIAGKGPDGLQVGELATLVDTPVNTMSTHLTILERAGLVRKSKAGRSVIYAAQPEATKMLAVFLLECGSGK